MQCRVHDRLGLGTIMEGHRAGALFSNGVNEFHGLVVAEGHQRIAHLRITWGTGPDPEFAGHE